jgi:photosystem II stability/assembly factor-like uncharacterized protein
MFEKPTKIKVFIFCVVLLALSVNVVIVYSNGWRSASHVFKDNIGTIQNQWKISNSNPPLTRDIFRLTFVTASDGWLLSDQGILYVTTDGGESWIERRLTLPARTSVTGLCFTSDLLGWAVIAGQRFSSDRFAGARGWLLFTKDGGQTWASKNSQLVEAEKIIFTSDTEGWAFHPRLYHSRDAGENWDDLSQVLYNSRVKSHSTSVIVDIKVLDRMELAVLMSTGELLQTSNNGASWKMTHSLPDFYSHYSRTFKLLKSASGSLFLLAAADGREGTWTQLLRFNQDGSLNTIHINTGQGSVFLSDAIFLTDDELVACGTLVFGSPVKKRKGVIIQSSDAGENWSIIYQDNEIDTINVITSFGNKHLWAGGSGGRVLKLKAE